MFHVIFLISLIGSLFNLTSKIWICYHFLSIKFEGGECCPKKIVGGKTYNLVRNNDKDINPSLGCKNACSYALENDPNPGQKYCFAPGEKEVKCLSSGGIIWFRR